MLIGLSGIKHSGKDTIADIFVQNYNFKKMAFADKLKEFCSEVFDLPTNMFYRTEFKERVFEAPIIIDVSHIKNLVTLLEEYTSISNESYEALLSKGIDKVLLSPREILQFVGTDLCRNCVKDSIWVDIFNTILEKTEGHIVVTDARFSNERQLIKKHLGTNILVSRPDSKQKDTHVSENSLGDISEYDVIITNDDTIVKLEHDVKMWFTDRMPK